MEDDLKKNKMEDILKHFFKKEDDLKKSKNGRRPPKKMEDIPINQIQPNWL